MSENFTVETIEFKMKTQAMLNFAPMVFTIRQPRRRDLQLTEKIYWDEEIHTLLGKNFITTLDQDGKLHQIRIEHFLKEYALIQQVLESKSHLIKDTFTLLQEGLTRVTFGAVMTMAYNKYAMTMKMRSRSSL